MLLIENDQARWVLLMTHCMAVQQRAPRCAGTMLIKEYRAVGNWGLQFAVCGGLASRAAKAPGLGVELPPERCVRSIRN